MVGVLHLFYFAIGILAMFAGCHFGYRMTGIAGGVIGGLAGIVMVVMVYRIHINWMALAEHRRFGAMSTEELREFLRGPVWPGYHIAFYELSQRGEDIESEFDVVLDFLVSENHVNRIHGWTILKRYFPDKARRIPDYRPQLEVERCRQLVESAGFEQVQPGVEGAQQNLNDEGGEG